MVNLDWDNLGFNYIQTPYNVRVEYKDGKWGEIETHTNDMINLSIASCVFHYGQEVFEGLKAQRGKDGKVRLFRADQNAKRLANSAAYLQMAEPPLELFIEAVEKAVKLNSDYVPPYESSSSLYIRPFLIGTTPQVGVNPAKEYSFIVFVTPVGPYFKGLSPIPVVLQRSFDRAAPQGTGHVKAGGNYAAGLAAHVASHNLGYGSTLYLDAKSKRFIEECGAANFFGIKDGKYITPASPSILPSITNNSLMQIAKDLGLEVEARDIEIEEVATFQEVGSCGTAAVISPISRIYDADNDISYNFGDGVGEWSQKLYDRLIAIQKGDCEDIHGWVTIVE